MANYKLASYHAYLKACDFLSVAKDLDRMEHCKIVPMVVNASFSCELYLKALLIWQFQKAVPLKKHSLEELYAQLDQEDQVAIKADADILDWESFMRESKNSFEKWRYVHEQKGCLTISISDLFNFAEALKRRFEERYMQGERFDEL